MKKTYTIIFSSFGRKMRTKIMADSKYDAIQKLQRSVNIIDIQEDDELGFLKDMLGIK